MVDSDREPSDAPMGALDPDPEVREAPARTVAGARPTAAEPMDIPAEPDGDSTPARSLFFRIRVQIATVFGLGLFPIASGTVGSAATLPLAALIALAGPVPFLIAAALCLAVALACAGAAEDHYRTKDPHAIIIDEVAGQFVALAFVPLSVLGFASSFFFFRFFDVVKPYPASRLERLRGAPGIVLDDIAAGIYANLVTHALLRVAGWMGSAP